MKRNTCITIFLIFVVVLRLITLGIPKLTDPSEARYANTARRIVETNNWILPETITLEDTWEPYLSKPPLNPWLNALAYKAFGISTWSTRIIPLLSTCGTFLLLLIFGMEFFPESVETFSLLFWTLPSVLFLCCAATPDPLLMLCVTGAIVAFTLSQKQPKWMIYHIIFIALGFLTKGPIGIAMTWGVLGVWLLWTKKLSRLKTLPWVLGSILFFGIVVPWYVLVEMKSPGFLYYFFIHENFDRYIYEDFGNKFGSGHIKPYGTSILYTLALLLPWSGALLGLISKETRARCKNWILNLNEIQKLLIVWLVFPPLLLLLARQILPTYLYFSIPPGVFLASLFMNQTTYKHRVFEISAALFVLSAVLLIASTGKIENKISVGGLAKELENLKGKNCACFRLAVKLPQSLYFYGREVLGDYSEFIPGKDTLSTGQCVVIPKRGLSELTMSQYNELITVGDWSVLQQR